MQLGGLHILLTCQCTYACEHCFVWGSPWGQGTFTLDRIDQVLEQARAAGVGMVYFEGGEPFLYYALLLGSVRRAQALGLSVGVVTNAYWAVSEADALAALRPFAGLLADLTISSDSFHSSDPDHPQARHAAAAARALGIPLGSIAIARPGEADGGALMFRGRASRLAGQVPGRPWTAFRACPYEDLRDPGRVHLDPDGGLQLCQGLTIGNLFERPLDEISRAYDPDAHPLVGPLLAGGPAGLVETYDLPMDGLYADACHLCYQARLRLRDRFPAWLGPDQMYGGNEA